MTSDTERAIEILKAAHGIHDELRKDAARVDSISTREAWLTKAKTFRDMLNDARDHLISAIERGTTRESEALRCISHLISAIERGTMRESEALRCISQELKHLDTAEEELGAYEFGS